MSDAFRFLSDEEFQVLTTQDKVRYISEAHAKLAQLWHEMDPPGSVLVTSSGPATEDKGSEGEVPTDGAAADEAAPVVPAQGPSRD